MGRSFRKDGELERFPRGAGAKRARRQQKLSSFQGVRGCMKILLCFVAVAALAGSAVAASTTPLSFIWPTSVEIEPGGSLLIVENGLRRLVRVSPAGRVTQVAMLSKPYAVARSRSGRIYVTDGPIL